MKKPTVTELIALLDKPALLKWANKIGLEGVSLEEFRAASKGKGISLHNQIQLFFEKKIPFIDPVVQESFDKFIVNKQIIDLEQNISTEWFVGRYDAKIKVGDKTYICDFKSNHNIYLEQKLQLSAYKMAYPECDIAIIEIPSFTFKPLEFNFKKCELILKCLHKIWELKQFI